MQTITASVVKLIKDYIFTKLEINKIKRKKVEGERDGLKIDALSYLLEWVRETLNWEYQALTSAIEGFEDRFQKGLVRFVKPLNVVSIFYKILVVLSNFLMCFCDCLQFSDVFNPGDSPLLIVLKGIIWAGLEKADLIQLLMGVTQMVALIQIKL